MLKDLKFYSILPAMLASSFIITGIVINQTFIIVTHDKDLAKLTDKIVSLKDGKII